jgi:biotin operon repressor
MRYKYSVAVLSAGDYQPLSLGGVAATINQARDSVARSIKRMRRAGLPIKRLLAFYTV